MSAVSIRSEGVPQDLERTCTDRSVEAIPERDPKYQLPICNPTSETQLLPGRAPAVASCQAFPADLNTPKQGI